MAFGPALLPVLATATAGVVGLGAALSGAGAAVGVFGAVAKSAFTEIKTASDTTQTLRDKIALLTEQAKVAERTGLADAGKIEAARDKAITELMARYNLMPPALRKVTMAYDGMKASWKGFVDQNKPAVYATLTSGFSSISTIVPKLQPLFDTASAAVGRLTAGLARAASGGGVDRLVAWLNGQAAPALDNLIRIGRNVGVTLAAAFQATAPAGQGLLSWLTRASDKAASFAAGGGFARFMAYVSSTGPTVVSTLANLATAAGHIAQAVTPLAPVSLAVANALSAIIAALPPGVITALVVAWIAYSAALRGYNVAVLAVGIATKGAAVAQKIWNAAVVAGNFARASAQIALFLVKMAALKVATLAAAGAQAVWNGAVIAANFARATAQIALFLVQQGLVAVATKLWAAAQWILNVAMSANPLSLIIIGIAALIAVIVLLWIKCAWFRNFWITIWQAIVVAAQFAWKYIKIAALAFWDWIRSVPGWVRDRWNAAWNAIKSAAAAAWGWVQAKVSAFYNWIVGIPGKVSGKLRSTFDGLLDSARRVFNRVASFWNSTVGRISFHAPDWIPGGIGGKGFSVPNIPMLAKGGTATRSGLALVGERGPEVLSLNRGAQVTPLSGGRGRGESTLVIDVRGADSAFGQLLLSILRGSPATASSARRIILKAA